MKRKRKTKIYVKVVGLKIRLAGEKKIRKVIGHTGNIIFWRWVGGGGFGANMPLAHYTGERSHFFEGYMKYQSSSSTGWGQWRIKGRSRGARVPWSPYFYTKLRP